MTYDYGEIVPLAINAFRTEQRMEIHEQMIEFKI